MNPRDTEQNLRSPKAMMITVLAKDVLRWPVTIWFTSFFLCHKRWKCRMQKAAVDKAWKTLEQFQQSNWKNQEQVATLMDICHLKNAESEPKLQKYNGRVVLRGDMFKDDSGARAVFAEQGSSASQMTAAKVMDVIATVLPDCGGQPADAVSACTQVTLEGAPRLLNIPKSECPDVWIRQPRHKWPKSWSNSEVPVVLLERNLYGHPSISWIVMGETIRRSLIGTWMGKHSELGMYVRSSETGYFCQNMWMTSKWLERCRPWLPCGKRWWTMWILMNPHHFLTWRSGMYSAWMQTEWNNYWTIQEDVWITYVCWSNWKVTTVGKPHVKTVAWSFDMEGHARKCVERYCELANKKVEQLYKVWSPLLAWSSSQAGRTWISWRMMTRMLTNCFEMLALGTNWTTWHSVVGQQACEISYKMNSGMWQTICRLISYNHHTNDYRQFCHVGSTAQHCRLVLFPDPDSAGDLEDSQSTSGGVLCIFGSRTFVPSQLDVQETDCCLAQFYRVWNHFSGCWTSNGWPSCSRPLGRGNWGVAINKQHKETD